MSDSEPTENAGPLPGLHDLIRSGMSERGWSYSDLERASDRALTRGRWQQLGAGVPQRKFPDPESLKVIAQVLEVDITTVVLAAAQSLGLDVTRRGPDLSLLLPEQTERLSERMRDAILLLIRAAVAETTSATEAEPDVARASSLAGLHLEWPKTSAPSEAAGERPGPS